MIDRRQAGLFAVSSLFVGASFGIARAATGLDLLRMEAARGVVNAFYVALNKSSWAALGELMTDHVRGRADVEFVEIDASCAAAGDCKNTRDIGGHMNGRLAIIEFLSARQQMNDWVWRLEDDGRLLTSSSDGYVSTVVRRTKAGDECKTFGTQCASDSRFVHVFLCEMNQGIGGILDCRISNFTEVELEKPEESNGRAQ